MSDNRKYKDRASYLIKAVTKRRRSIKSKLIEYKGGKCCICGYRKYEGALEFHHLDDSQKSFGLSAQGLTRSLESVKHEADKCILVCSNCHKEIHANKTQPPRETLE